MPITPPPTTIRVLQIRHLQDLIAVHDVPAVQGNRGRFGRLGAGSDHNRGGFIVGLSQRTQHAEMRRIDELRHARNHIDAVSRKLRLRHIDLGLDHMLDPEQQIRHRNFFLHAVVDAVDVLVMVAGQVQHGFPHRLAGNGAGVDTAAPESGNFFD